MKGKILLPALIVLALVMDAGAQPYEFRQKLLPDLDGYFKNGAVVAMDGEYAVSSNSDFTYQHADVFVFKLDGNTWTRSQRIAVPSANELGHGFGYALAISGDNLAIGGLDRVYLYALEDGTWIFKQTVVAADWVSLQHFGRTISLVGDRLLVGSPNKGPAGAAYFFEKGVNGWVQTVKLQPGSATAAAEFGVAVDLDGNTAVVGASKDAAGGSAFVFEFDGTSWNEAAKLTHSNPQGQLYFGAAVSIHQSRIGVSRTYEGTSDSGGEIFLFEKIGSTWTETQTFSFPNDVWMTYALDLHGNTLAVGGLFYDDVHVFKHDGNQWVFDKTIVDPYAVPQESLKFGSTLAASDQFVLIGHPNPDKYGRIFFYEKTSNDWILNLEYLADGAPSTGFGFSGVNQDFLAIGAGSEAGAALRLYKRNGDTHELSQSIVFDYDPNASGGGPLFFGNRMFYLRRTSESGSPAGGMFYYELESNQWVYKQTIAPPTGWDLLNPGFGSRLSVDGDWAILSTGSPIWHTFVYFYHYENGQWVFKKQISSEDLGLVPWDYYGISVSISGDFAVVGSAAEDIGGLNTGALYVYHFNGSEWVQYQKLTSVNPYIGQTLGMDVSISGTRIAATAPMGAVGGPVEDPSYEVRYYDLVNDVWTQNTNLTIAEKEPFSVAFDGNRVVMNFQTLGPHNTLKYYELHQSKWYHSDTIPLPQGGHGYLQGNFMFTNDAFNFELAYTATPVLIFEQSANRSPLIPQQADKSAVTFHPVTTTLNSFLDLDGDPLTYTAKLSDGSPLPSWLLFDSQTLGLQGTPPLHSEGVLEVIITASDAISPPSSSSFKLNIAPNQPPALQSTIDNIQAEVAESFAFAFPGDLFSDPEGDPISYTAEQSNNALLPSWLSFVPSNRAFSGIPQASDAGIVEVRVTAYDPFDASGEVTFQIEVPAIVTGIQPESSRSVWFYPNPASESVTFDPKTSKDYAIEITSVLGIKVIQVERAIGEYKINLSEFPRGLYMVTITPAGERQVVQKLMLGN